MRLLLRLATRAAWPGGEPDRQRALGDFRLRDGESGLSLWAFETDVERDLILGAITCERIAKWATVEKVSNVDYLTIPAEMAERLGAVVVTPGDTPVPQANRLHRELQWEQAAIDVLAGELFDSGSTVTRLGKKDALRRAIALSSDEIGDETVRALLDSERLRQAKK